MSNDDKLSEDPSTRPGISLVDLDGNCIPDTLVIDIRWLLTKICAVVLCAITVLSNLLPGGL